MNADRSLPPSEYPTLASYVSARRLELGLTQVDLSSAVGMSQEWASNVETGKVKNPRMNTLRRLADVLRVPFDDLLLTARYATTRTGAKRIADQESAKDTEEIPPHMRASFLKAGDLSPERQQLLKDTIDTFYEADEAYREQIKRDVARRREGEGLD